MSDTRLTKIAPTSLDLLDAAISLAAELDAVRAQALACAQRIEPYAEIHPYLNTQIDALRAIAFAEEEE